MLRIKPVRIKQKYVKNILQLEVLLDFAVDESGSVNMNIFNQLLFKQQFAYSHI